MTHVFESMTNKIIAVTSAVYILELVYPRIVLYGSLIPALVFERPRTLITHAFLHANFAHLFFNMLFLWVLGRHLEQIIGDKAFLVSYLAIAFTVGVLHTLLCLIALPQYAYVPAIGASGAIMGVLGMSVVYLRDMELFVILFPIPIPLRMSVKQLALTLFILETFMALLGIEPGVAHDAHIFGLIIGYLLAVTPRFSWKYARVRMGEISVFWSRKAPKYMREFSVYDSLEGRCLKYLHHILSRVMRGRPVDPTEVFAVLNQCSPDILMDVWISLDRNYLTSKELKALLIAAMIDTLIRAYESGSVDVTFKRLS